MSRPPSRQRPARLRVAEPAALAAALSIAYLIVSPASGDLAGALYRAGLFEHHGFVNILVATAAAIDGAGNDELARRLAERDPAAVARQAAATDWDTATRARLAFVGFGTCSLAEAVDDLLRLGLLEEAQQ